MSKYTLTVEHCDNTKVTVEFEAETLDRVLENTEYFLKGAGFFFDGNLDFVQDDSDSITTDNIDLSPSIFDTMYSKYGSQACHICKLTAEELGKNICFDKNCPMVEKVT